MRIAAVGDVHGREFLAPFREALRAVGAVDLFLLAGDLTDRNRREEFAEVVAAVRERIDGPLVGVFGNNEWEPDHGAYRASHPDVVFLDDEDRRFEIDGEAIRVIGSTGSLDEPTRWQRAHVPGIAARYEARVRRLDDLLAGDDLRLLLTHYPPTYATMGGEKEPWRPQLGSRALERVVLRRRPDVVVHGHVHKGIAFADLRTGQATLDAFPSARSGIPVHNVAFPVTRAVTVLDVTPANPYTGPS